MKKQILCLIFAVGGTYVSYGQVGIGTTSPNGSSQLEVVATDKGILIPRIALIGTTDSVTIKNGNIKSLLVFNTATVADITPGYYYWNDGKWLRILSTDSIPNNMVTWDVTNNQFSYIDNKGVSNVLNIANIVAQNETLTSISQDTAAGTITYKDEKGVSTVLTTGMTTGSDISAGSDKIILGGTTTGAALKPFSVDVDESKLSLANIGGKITNSQIINGAANQILVTNAAGTGTEWISQSDIVPATTNSLTSINNNLTSNVNGVSQTALLINSNTLALDTDKKLIGTVNGVATTPLDLSTIVTENQKTSSVANGTNTTVISTVAGNNTQYAVNANVATAAITGVVKPGTGISVDNAGALTIDDNSITPAKINAPAGSNKLVLGYDGAGIVNWTTVDAIANSTSVSNTLSGSQLSTTVNGTTGAAVDLKNAVQAGQKNTSVGPSSNKVTVVTTGSGTTGNNTEYSVDINESNLALSNIGGKLTASQITNGGANQILVTNAAGTSAQWVNQSTLVPATTNILTLTANTLKSSVNGVDSTINLTDANLTSSKSITGTDNILVTGGANSSLKDVSLAIKPGAANQILATNAAGSGTEWITQSAVVAPSPTTNVLTSTNNNLTSNVNGVSDSALLINSNTLVLDTDKKLVSSVNGVATPPLDLTTAITANQKNFSVANGTNTTVTSTTTGNNTQYIVNANVATATITGAVKPGSGLTVDAAGTLNVDATTLIPTGKALTSTDLSVSANGSTALLKDVTVNINADAITSAKIKDGEVKVGDLGTAGAADANKIYTTNGTGVPTLSATLAASSVVGANVTAASSKVTLAGTPVGSVLKAFSVDVNEANLTLTNQIATGTANQVFVVDGTTSKAKWVDQSTLADNTTVNNGLTKTANNVQLGGALTKATIITNSGQSLTIASGGSDVAITGLTAGAPVDKIVVVDASGVLKTASAAVASGFFYAPSMIMPTVNANLPSNVTYNAGTGVFTVDMYTTYNSQFTMTGDVAGAGRTAIKSAGAGTLNVVPANGLGYFVTYFDSAVFDPTSITLTADGKLSYKIVAGSTVTSKTYMNVVFKVL